MIAIDTNVLVRFLVSDPNAKEQSQLARALLNSQNEVWVCQIVLIETVWVLQSSYKFTKEQIVSVLEKLIQHPCVHLENAANLDNALTVFSTSNAGFADCLILNDARKRQLVLYTFDRKLSRLYGAKNVVNE
ncbi:MAG: type II toxin-antitoxin system VapC family toxin [Desulfamplus sp.]|nr:type II toxin-antitoxin system VapC family toxin [Desulfamplus sp.]